MQTGKILLGTLAGMAIGTVVGILLAPDKGSETRKKLVRKGGEFRDGIKNRIDGVKERYNDTIDNVTNKIESMSGRAEEAVRHGKNAVSEAKAAANTATR
jgi:gas vesicle protein